LSRLVCFHRSTAPSLGIRSVCLVAFLLSGCAASTRARIDHEVSAAGTDRAELQRLRTSYEEELRASEPTPYYPLPFPEITRAIFGMFPDSSPPLPLVPFVYGLLAVGFVGDLAAVVGQSVLYVPFVAVPVNESRSAEREAFEEGVVRIDRRLKPAVP
jgi:hypothetical protein